MASGRLGAVDIVAATDTGLYTVPASTVATVNMNICNRGATAAVFRIAIVNGGIGAVANSDYIEFDVSLPANTSRQHTGLVMGAGFTILVRSDSASVNAVCWGFEDSI